ncbi:MAG: hypothetical protein CME86_13170 [Herbaspirillum sp.]|nr:hypothetical protein [Herbaspirillum sp.]|tara:strand:- start:2601 stop:4160 length:1560 start_codon:yes stop_codon:yes gene_type:complete
MSGRIIRAARIVLDTPIQVEKAWCWRDDWATGYDSAFGLLSKFARLNAMGARELADVFIHPDCGRRTAILRSPNVDLRSGELFDKEAISRHMRLPAESVAQAFLLENLVNSRRHSSDVLRWCPKCAHSGFHSALFQLSLVSVCPAHGQALRNRCPKCRHESRYALEPKLFASPFSCPHCGADFAPRLREGNLRSLKMRDQELGWIDNVAQLILFEDRMIPVKFDLNRRRKAVGLGEVAMSSADWRRVQADYTGFVSQVINELQAETLPSQSCLRYVSFDLVSRRTPRVPPTRTGNKTRRGKPLGILIDQLSSRDIKNSWDAQIASSYLVYSATRRYLWRHLLFKHQRCISSAAKHLWWHMEGEKTGAFCPVALAFLRWRMYWEACGVPRYLLAPMRKDPYGLITWYAAHAPVCPAGWTPEAEHWVANHVLGRSCFGSFREYLDLAMKDAKRDAVEWHSKALTGVFESYWAVTGCDSPSRPVRIYQQSGVPFDCSGILASIQSNPSHRAEHAARLAKICR